MSKWTTGFENHQFQEQLLDLIKTSSELKKLTGLTREEISNNSRFVKVVAYIDDLVKSVDPDLIPLTIWNSFNDYLTTCRSQINAYKTSRNIQYSNAAHDQLDEMLKIIHPYVKNGKSSAQAAAGAFRAYRNLVNSQIKIISNRQAEVIEEINKDKERSSKLMGGVLIDYRKIDEYQKLLFKGDESLKKRIDGLYASSSQMNDKINDYSQLMFIGTEEDSPIKRQILDAFNDIKNTQVQVHELLEDSNSEYSELSGYVDNTLGEADEEGQRVGGFQSELIGFKKDLLQHIANVETQKGLLRDFKKNQEDNYEELKSKINGLIPGATSAGLATSFNIQKKTYKNPIRNNTIIFLGTLAIIFGVATWSYISNTSVTPLEKIYDVLYKIPLILAPLWIALSASKRLSEARRLEQEYAHKEAVATSYIGFKEQIDMLDTKDTELMTKLLEEVIGAMVFNASDTLDKNHGDKLPAAEVIEKALEAVKSANNIPN